MNKEQIVRELRDLLDCTSFGHIRKDIQNLIDKLQPKPLFVVGPAKYGDGRDCNILAIHTDDTLGLLTEYKCEDGWFTRRHKLDGKGTDQNWDVMPNNESEEK